MWSRVAYSRDLPKIKEIQNWIPFKLYTLREIRRCILDNVFLSFCSKCPQHGNIQFQIDGKMISLSEKIMHEATCRPNSTPLAQKHQHQKSLIVLLYWSLDGTHINFWKSILIYNSVKTPKLLCSMHTNLQITSLRMKFGNQMKRARDIYSQQPFEYISRKLDK